MSYIYKPRVKFTYLLTNEGQNILSLDYFIIKRLTEKELKYIGLIDENEDIMELLSNDTFHGSQKLYEYSEFPNPNAKVIIRCETLKYDHRQRTPSYGFFESEWMINSILKYNKIIDQSNIPKENKQIYVNLNLRDRL